MNEAKELTETMMSASTILAKALSDVIQDPKSNFRDVEISHLATDVIG